MSYMRPSLQQTLRQLRLSGLAQSLEVRLAEAAGNRLDHGEFLELILQDELSVRAGRQAGIRVGLLIGMFRGVHGIVLGYAPADTGYLVCLAAAPLCTADAYIGGKNTVSHMRLRQQRFDFRQVAIVRGRSGRVIFED